jgi:hypothetical protein
LFHRSLTRAGHDVVSFSVRFPRTGFSADKDTKDTILVPLAVYFVSLDPVSLRLKRVTEPILPRDEA